MKPLRGESTERSVAVTEKGLRVIGAANTAVLVAAFRRSPRDSHSFPGALEGCSLKQTERLSQHVLTEAGSRGRQASLGGRSEQEVNGSRRTGLSLRALGLVRLVLKASMPLADEVDFTTLAVNAR